MFRRSHVTLTKLLLPVFFFVVPFVVTCPDGNCLVGGFFFALGRNMLDNHALVGHVFNSNTVTEPMSCFKKCQSDCRCISFNYLPSEKQDNCQLNNENKNTNSSALQPNKGSQYYDLVINYKIRVSIHFHVIK